VDGVVDGVGCLSVVANWDLFARDRGWAI